MTSHELPTEMFGQRLLYFIFQVHYVMCDRDVQMSKLGIKQLHLSHCALRRSNQRHPFHPVYLIRKNLKLRSSPITSHPADRREMVY
jgi:hypothetical protein